MTKVMNFKWKLSKNQKGLTLIELLAVVVILGILAAVGGVAVMGGFNSAKTNADATNVQIITDAVQRYVLDGGIPSDVEATDRGSSIAALTALQNKGFLNSIPRVSDGDANTSYFSITIAGNVVTVTAVTP